MQYIGYVYPYFYKYTCQQNLIRFYFNKERIVAMLKSV